MLVKKLVGLEKDMWEDINKVKETLGLFTETAVIRMAVKLLCKKALKEPTNSKPTSKKRR